MIEISRNLRKRFNCPDPVLLVTNVGGFSENRHLETSELKPMRQRLIQSLNQINTEGEVEIIPQTMPPFPWHFGGQRYHNLFVDSDFIKSFCEETGMRVCLDVSHSKLACTHLNASFSKFLKSILPLTAHSSSRRQRGRRRRSTNPRRRNRLGTTVRHDGQARSQGKLHS